MGDRSGATRVVAWDGLRGLAVAGVVAYHLRAPWLPGGFLGVSLFFTLSGYLITGLLADELAREGRVDIAAFWARRFRRLLPAALACVGLVLALSRLYSDSQQSRLRGDTAAMLADVANWRFLASRVVYGGADPHPSPLRHAWSLAIEEQFYVLLPLAFLVGWWLWRRRGVVVVLGVALAASIVSGAVVGHHPATAYFRTDVRIAEILVGSVGALVVRTAARATVVRWCRRLAPVALAGLLASWAAAHETSGFLPRGGFLLHALGAVVVVIGVSAGGLLDRALGAAPLAALGRISYGVYLYHWPLFLVLTPGRLGTSTLVADVVALGAALGAAVLSWFALERPVQRWQPGSSRRPLTLAPASSLSVFCLAALVIPHVASSTLVTLPSVADDEVMVIGDVAEPSTPPMTTPAPATSHPLAETSTTATTSSVVTTATGQAAPSTTERTSTAPVVRAAASRTITTEPKDVALFVPPLPPAADIGRVPTILIAGDSVAWSIAASSLPGKELHGLARWGQDTGLAHVVSVALLACGVSTYEEGRWTAGNRFGPPERCDWRKQVPVVDAKVQPDVVFLLTGLWEITDRRLPSDDQWRAIGDPKVDADLAASLFEYITLQRSLGVRVVLVLPPDIAVCEYYDPTGPCPYPEDDPARMAAWRTLERQVAAEAGATVFDLPALLAEHGLAAAKNRHDGLHWSPDQADRDAQWLGPILTDAAIRLIAASPA